MKYLYFLTNIIIFYRNNSTRQNVGNNALIIIDIINDIRILKNQTIRRKKCKNWEDMFKYLVSVKKWIY